MGWTADSGVPYPSEPQASPLSPSGMRPVSEFFADIGLVIRRGWKQILVISLVVWVLAGAILAGLSSLTIDFGEFRTLMDDVEKTAQQYNGSSIPESVGDQLLDQAERAFPLSLAGYIGVGVGLAVIFLLASAYQTAAINRIAIDAASDQSVTWSAGWRGGLVGGLRLLLVWILLGLFFSLMWGGWIGLIVLAAMVNGWLAAAVGFTGFVVVFLLTLWISARLVPMSAQAPMGGAIIRWSWSHTRGKTLAVFGRWILWVLIASLVLQTITSVIAFPLGLIPSAASPEDFVGFVAGAMAVAMFTMPIYSALSGLMTIGSVPIWRDLTDQEPYRSIDEHGQPKRVRSQPTY